MKTEKTDPLFNEFCMERNLSENSIKHYKWALDRYSSFNNLTLTELIEEADTEEEQGIRQKKRKIVGRLKNYRSD